MRIAQALNRAIFLAPFVFAACGSGPALTSGSVTVVATGTANSYVAGAALGKNEVYVWLVGTQQSQSLTLATLDFDTATSTPSTWTPTQQATLADAKISVAPGGNIIWCTLAQPGQSAGGQSPALNVYLATPAAFSSGASATPIATVSVNMSTQTLVGFLTDATSIFVAYTTAQTVNTTGSPPDSQNFPGNAPNTSPVAGTIARIDRANPTTVTALPGSISFVPEISTRALTQNTSDVYWTDAAAAGSNAASIMHVSKTNFGSSAGTLLAGVPQKGNAPLTVTGIDANDAAVAWSVAPAPTLGAVGCQIYAAGVSGNAKPIFDSDTTPIGSICTGLVIDDTYAYVALDQVIDDNNPGSAVLVGTGIGRVPLAGGPMQVVSLASSHWFGPRRVLVDDTYVYGVDPDFIARVPKTAFPN